MSKSTESPSKYKHLEKMPVSKILAGINKEDDTVAQSVKKAIPQIEKAVQMIASKMKKGGRIFYVGAGTSGRLGIVDASECPPTYGIEQGKVIGLIAGGDSAIRKAVEFAEDDETQAWIDLQPYKINKNDVLVGIAASGKTPYVLGAVKKCNEKKITTVCIVCNTNSALAKAVQYPIEVSTGAEFVTGSTRMKAGTAQKMVLNMISTSVMIKMGRVKGNKMVDMQLSNNKLVERGTLMLMNELNIPFDAAQKLLLKKGSVRKALEKKKK
ncbi:MAG: N-acetylmuramic acid 6-phosphate etherase [Bacteroidetes bacterium]|nr:N-acetylmuramic acid 6-phosphate etherase [Bacteroidota bacterium]